MSNNYKKSTNNRKNFSQIEESKSKNSNELIDIDSKKNFNNSISISPSQNFLSQMINSNFSNYNQDTLINKQIFDSKNNNSFSKKSEFNNPNYQSKFSIKLLNSNFQNSNLIFEKRYININY